MINNLLYELLQEAFSKKIIPYPLGKEEAYNQGVLACKSILHDIQKRGFRGEDIARVVRCKDCIYRTKEDSPFYALMKGYCNLNDKFVPDDFYCAVGTSQTYPEKYRNKIKASSLYGEMKEDAKR